MKHNINKTQKENLHVVLRLGKFAEHPIKVEPIEEYLTSARFGQMSAFLKLQIFCDNLKLGGMHDSREKVQDFV
jgi:hypothetical protein